MRTAEISRDTLETKINVKINLDGTGKSDVKTGIGFFDHMITALSKHSSIDIELYCDGDLNVDCHHTIEDCGIVLGLAIEKALEDKTKINRYGSFYIPMDEALGFCSIDISSRSYLVYKAQYVADKIGEMNTQMIEEFFRAICYNAKITCHLICQYGNNDHHICEALFKAFAHSLKIAIKQENETILTTKGLI